MFRKIGRDFKTTLGFSEDVVDQYTDALETLESFEGTAISKFADEYDVHTLEAYNKQVEHLNEGIEQFERDTDDGIGNVTDMFIEGTNALNDFNNAREELFFGFKAGNVTGDLISLRS